MSAIQQAAANTVFRIANLFEQNCALKHGLPKIGGPDRIDDVTQPTAQPPINIVNNIPAATAADNSPSPGLGAVAVTGGQSLLRRAAPFLLTGAAGAGIPLLMGLAHQPKATEPPAPAFVQPAEQSADGSLLQFLQDHGQHLPEGTSWPTK